MPKMILVRPDGEYDSDMIGMVLKMNDVHIIRHRVREALAMLSENPDAVGIEYRFFPIGVSDLPQENVRILASHDPDTLGYRGEYSTPEIVSWLLESGPVLIEVLDEKDPGIEWVGTVASSLTVLRSGTVQVSFYDSETHGHMVVFLKWDQIAHLLREEVPA